ncbi:CPCC family cysteine-rich protein [Streptomyces sioyaensis]|uniref:CPCC family cysteine-rich protein n=1 Tax=Streptomyces sioyaensis TaxID=67364 RepID=UPI0037A632A1
MILTCGGVPRRALTWDSSLACVGSRRPLTGVPRTGCGLARGCEAAKSLAHPETAQVSDSYPCPCCGHRVLGAMPGSNEICPVCFWAHATGSSRRSTTPRSP